MKDSFSQVLYIILHLGSGLNALGRCFLCNSVTNACREATLAPNGEEKFRAR